MKLSYVSYFERKRIGTKTKNIGIRKVPMVERVIRTVKEIVRLLPSTWSLQEKFKMATAIYNSAFHETIGCFPFFMRFHRDYQSPLASFVDRC